MSASHIESMSILRLRICGKNMIMLPMEAKHFFFLNNAGAYHLVST